jgi:hypothetical protein
MTVYAGCKVVNRNVLRRGCLPRIAVTIRNNSSARASVATGSPIEPKLRSNAGTGKMRLSFTARCPPSLTSQLSDMADKWRNANLS